MQDTLTCWLMIEEYQEELAAQPAGVSLEDVVSDGST